MASSHPLSLPQKVKLKKKAMENVSSEGKTEKPSASMSMFRPTTRQHDGRQGSCAIKGWNAKNKVHWRSSSEGKRQHTFSINVNIGAEHSARSKEGGIAGITGGVGRTGFAVTSSPDHSRCGDCGTTHPGHLRGENEKTRSLPESGAYRELPIYADNSGTQP
jgi:hypothetical protein